MKRSWRWIQNERKVYWFTASQVWSSQHILILHLHKRSDEWKHRIWKKEKWQSLLLKLTSLQHSYSDIIIEKLCIQQKTFISRCQRKTNICFFLNAIYKLRIHHESKLKVNSLKNSKFFITICVHVYRSLEITRRKLISKNFSWNYLK